jgi:cephalosporin hydroxylase
MWASLLELNGLHNSTVVTVDIAPPGAPHAFGADSKAPAQLVTATGQVIAAPTRRPQTNPVKHHLWRKYVQFVQGSSTEPATVMQVKAIMAARQQRLVASLATPGEEVADAAASYGGSMSASISSEADAAAATASAAGSPSVRVLVLLDSHHSALHVLTEMEAYCGLVSPGSFCIIEDTKLTRWTNADAGPLESVRSFVSLHPEFRVQRDRELLFTHHPYGYLQRLY